MAKDTAEVGIPVQTINKMFPELDKLFPDFENNQDLDDKVIDFNRRQKIILETSFESVAYNVYDSPYTSERSSDSEYRQEMHGKEYSQEDSIELSETDSLPSEDIYDTDLGQSVY